MNSTLSCRLSIFIVGMFVLSRPVWSQSLSPHHENAPASDSLAANRTADANLLSLQSELQSLQARLDQFESTHAASDLSTHDVFYDAGWTLTPRDVEATPFQMRIGLQNQFRFTNFSADDDLFVDSAGNSTIVRDRNDFDVNRGRLVFDGFAFHEKLGYYVNIDYNTVSSNPIQLLLSWISFECSEALTIHMGLGKLPGTWEWQQSSRFPLGVERTLATTFFRPSISAGVWATGSFFDSVYYRAMVADGFNTFSLRAAELDTHFAYSTLWWWEPLEEFGVGFSDLENHERPAIRIGHGLTQNTNDETFLDSPGPEQTVVRLSDGTQLVTPDALVAGETVGAFDQWLYTVHAGMKFRGWSLSGEGFFRWLRNIQSVDGDDLGSLFDSGYYAQVSKLLVRDRLEAYGRTSYVAGDFGDGRENAIGCNWYLFGARSARATLEITDLQDSPAQQSRTAFVAGGNGTIVQAQLWTFF